MTIDRYPIAGATQASLDVRFAPVSSGRPGNRTVALGDSITLSAWDAGAQVQGSSWPLYAQMFSSGKIFLAQNAGIAGDGTAQMLARFATDVAAYAPSTVIIAGGTNDIGDDVALATTKTNIASIVAETRAIPAVPVLCTIAPNDDSARHNRIATLNNWLRRYASANGIALIDHYALLVDPTNGNYQSGYSSGDGTHPNVAGFCAMGQLVSTVLSPLLPAWSPPLTLENSDSSGLFTSNPLLITDTNADGVPDGWVAYGGSATHSLITAAGVPGKMMQMVRSAGSSVRVLEREVSTGFSAGDRLSVCAVVSSDGGIEAELKVNFAPTGGGLPAKFTAPVTTGVVYQELVVPSGTTTITAQVVGGSGTGTISVGQFTILNLTALGIV